MSTERKSHKNPSSSTSTIVSVSNPSASIPPTELPQEIILSILKRLPVKSILRFNCVSKDWLSLLSSPNFISIHLQQTFKTPLNDSFIIRCHDKTSLLNLNSIEREPVNLVNLFPEIFSKMELVGSINGLLCLNVRSLGQTVVLWNPAMNLHKAISLQVPDVHSRTFSLGFAYDSVNDDYNIIQIIKSFGLPETETSGFLRYHAEVYSASLDSWKRVQLDFHFHHCVSKSNLVVNGIPYWSCSIYQPNNQGRFRPILMYYDVQDGSFKHVLPPKMDIGHPKKDVDWKGNLGIIVISPSKDREYFVDIWVYDEMRTCYNKISSHGPVIDGVKEFRPMQCSKDGLILAETPEGQLVLYNPVTNGIKELCHIPGALMYCPVAFTYTESLVTVKGMEKFKEQNKEDS